MSPYTDPQENDIALIAVDDPPHWQRLSADLSDEMKAFARAQGFQGEAGSHAVAADGQGVLQRVWFSTDETHPLYRLATLVDKLPAGHYRPPQDWDQDTVTAAALGWGLAAYRFDRYRDAKRPKALLALPETVREAAETLLQAQNLVRDLVNTPTEDMGPAQLAAAVYAVAEEFGAEIREVVGEDLLDEGFPAVHAVGRASHRPPRLVRLRWGDPEHPRLAVVGKGVCFDTGGLNLKNASGMRKMKKDMGGAAHALGLARLVMEGSLPVRLDLLIPAVENAVAGDAYRPGDVVPTRKGLSVEIGNTDAEGRVILSDALTLACESEPDLLIDFATLTGAARVALGPDLPPLFATQDSTAEGIRSAGERVNDPIWPMPLWPGYRDFISSDIADICNNASTGFGGAMTAALFLQSFVEDDTDWVHIDTYAWSDRARPGRPKGGEALGMRAVWSYLQARYSG